MQSFCSPSASSQLTGISQKEACKFMWHTTLVNDTQGTPPDSLSMVVSGSYAHSLTKLDLYAY